METDMKPVYAMLLAIPLIVTAALSAPAQDQGNVASSYAGMESRPLKALSDQQMADLKAGRGMGLALAAELNGYPGPRHVLDLADQLQLTRRQRARTEELLETMKAETIAIGERILADEEMLDRLFAERRITPETLQDLTARIGSAQGRLRAAHLRYHLSMMEVLSPVQVAHYAASRGYGAGSHHADAMH
jgi:hypothetical protein